MKNTYLDRQRCTASKRGLLLPPLLTRLLFIALVFCFASAEAQQSKQKNLFPPGTEVSEGKKSLPDPLRPYDSLIDLKFAEKSPLKQSSGCDKLEVWQPVLAQSEQWRTIDPFVPTGASEVGILAVQASTNCVKVGHPMRIAHLRLPVGLGSELGWFFPTSMVGRRPEMAKQELRLLFKAGLPADTQDVVFVTGRVVATTPFAYRPLCPRMVGARFIDREQMETAIRNGTQVVDVRSKAAHAQFKIKGSINVPYSTGPRMNIFEEYAQYVKAGDAFDLRRVQQDKSKPVVIVGSFNDNAVYRAAVVLASEGWKNVLVFWEGIEYFTGMVWTPPATSNLVRVVDGVEVSALINDRSKKVVVVDVRSALHFSLGTIAGAYTSQFFERSDLHFRPQGLNGRMLADYGEWFRLPVEVPPASPIIVFGYNERDWAAYKTALILRQYGFGNVAWYRAGIGEWSNLHLLNPRKFPGAQHPWPFPKGFVGGPRK